MTETEQETPETPGEATESPETPSEPETDPETTEQPESPQETSDEPTGSLTKEQQDEIYVKMARRAENYFKSVKEMLDGVQVPLTPCELCGDAYPGLRWLQLEPESIDRVRMGLFGEPPLEELELDPDTKRCHRCKGKGIVKVDTDVWGQKVRVCTACNNTGYEVLNKDTGQLVAPGGANGHEQNDPLPGVNPADPEIANLIAQGYTIVPPMRPIATMETS